MHRFLRIGESILASRVPFVSMLNSTLIEEIIELIVVLLFVLDLGLRLLFVSIVVHPWSLVCFSSSSSCLLHIFASYSFFLFLLEFFVDFFKVRTFLVEPKDSLSY
jgi:hypothetical protein